MPRSRYWREAAPSFERGGKLRALLESIRAGADRHSTLLIASLAGVLFLSSWAAIHHSFYASHRIVDTPLYQHYGDWMMHGNVPYRDFSVEYPPGALPVFVLPAIGNSGSSEPSATPSHAYYLRTAYRQHFELLMALCGLASIALAAVALRSLEASNAWTAAALGVIVLSPLMLGSVFLSRFDLWPTMLALAALVAILKDRNWLGFGLLGLATAAKIFPVVLLPIGCVWIWKRRGWRELAICGGIFVAVLAACFAPFVILAPDGVAHAFSVQLGRPLQIESLGAAVLIGLHRLIGFGLTMQSGSGSQNLAGTGAEVVALVQSALQVVALLGVWFWFARGEANGERLVRASAAAIVAFVALGKVLSPQFLIWLIPFVVLVRGRRGIAASSLLALSLVLTQLWFPYRYWEYVNDFAGLPTVLVVVRDIVLLGIFVTLLLDLRRNEQEQPSLAPAAAAAA